MIDPTKLTDAERRAMAARADLVRQYFDEAHLISNELNLNPQGLPFVALMLLMLAK